MTELLSPVLLDRNDNGQEILSFELRNNNSASATILNLGATLTTLKIPTFHHGQINTILGYDNVDAYKTDQMYHGAIVGRYCNRISNGEFHLGGKANYLNKNEGVHHLHGGNNGFHRKIWEPVNYNQQYLHLRLLSQDGEEGYPGNLSVDLSYHLYDSNRLKIKWKARSDQNTIVNLANHCYFNLAGMDDIYNHYLKINADKYIPANHEQIPYGVLVQVENSPFDLRKFKLLKEIIDSDHPQILIAGGVDHNWARGQEGNLLPSAELYCPKTELKLMVSSTLPGIQCYTGNNLGIAGPHKKHEGVCLEAQYYPNSPNITHFPSEELKAGETIEHETLYEFSSVNRSEVDLKP